MSLSPRNFYRRPMSTMEIAVRIDDQLVQEMDAEIAQGRDRSRACLIEAAVRRELRRRAEDRDAAVLASGEGFPELDPMHSAVVRVDLGD
jgi:predicted transcriptional regulator